MIRLQAPASKSVSHRMLIAAALAEGESAVHNVLASADLEQTRAILQTAGAAMEETGRGSWKIRGMHGGPRGGLPEAPADCFVNESGTSCRLLSAVLAAGHGTFRIHGAKRMHERPIGALTKVLSSLGADIFFTEKNGFPPMLIQSRGLSGGAVNLRVDESSQYLSGMLLAAPFCASELCITLAGSKAVSWPYVGLTLQVLEDFGIAFRVEQLCGGIWQAVPWRKVACAMPHEVRITVLPGRYRAGEYRVEGDWSAASYLLAAGAAGKKPVIVENLRADSLQGDKVILDLLRAMGASVEVRADAVLVSPAALHGISADMGSCPDLVPTIAMLAAFAEGVTHIQNIAHLRIKECDRLSACAAELARIGVRTRETEDSLTVFGAGPQKPIVPAGVVFHTYNDHRMAMSCALFGLVPGNSVAVDMPSSVRKSFPEFWNVWSALL